MKKIVFSLVVPFFLYANSMSELFDALKGHVQAKSDEMVIKKAQVQKKLVQANLYPKVDLFVSYDNYSDATGMLPVPPNQLMDMVKDQTVPQPFSYNIYRAGGKFSMPIFMKSIYTMADKAVMMQKSAKAKKRINILKNEAIIVGANANFIYLVSLDKALGAKEKSLLETKKTLEIKVNNGRSPASSLYKINDAINQVHIEKNNIEIKKQELIATIERLSGICLEEPVPMEQIGDFKKGHFGSLKPLEEKLKADRLNIKVQKEKLYPALYAYGSYVFSKGKAYNNDKNINEEYGNIGVVLNIPLLEMTQYSSLDIAKIEFESSNVELAKMSDELYTKSKMLEKSLILLDNSFELYTKSVEDKKQLLNIAKVSYTSGRISTEEYLRYEDAVVQQESNLYKTKAQKWQTLMELAVIYANNIEEMVR